MNQLPPGPSLPSLAQLHQWVMNSPAFLEECAARYGDVFTVRLPKRGPVLVFHKPDDLRDIYTGDPNEFYAGDGNRILEALVGKNSLLLLDGARHLRERKLMLPAFHGERMQTYGTIIRDLTNDWISRAPRYHPQALSPAMQALTLEVIIRAVFGVTDDQGRTRLRDLLLQLLNEGRNPRVFAAMITLSPETLQNMLRGDTLRFSLGGRRVDLSRFAPWRSLSEAHQALNQFLLREFARRRAENDPSRDDILSMLLAARDEDGAPMSDEELRDEMLTLLVAGHETTATALSWAFWHILRDAELLSRLRAELDQVLGEGPLEPAKLQSLPLLDATIKESLRLTPTIGLTARSLKVDKKIGGYSLPAGSFLMQCSYLTHRRADVYPDPLRFQPERFLQKRSPGVFEYFPFGGGVRRCIGAAFATYEMKIVLAETLRRADLQLAPGYEAKVVRRNIAYVPSEGVPAILQGLRRPGHTRPAVNA